MGRRLPIVLAVAAALSGLGAMAPSAHAVFHLMKIREVYLGTGLGDDAFVELQMHAPSQTQVAGHKIDTYQPNGGILGSFTIPGNVANGENQRTILIGDTGVAGRDFTYEMLGDTVVTYGSGGMACFGGVDCVAWGNFDPNAAAPSPVGSPVLPAGIPAGRSINRSIARSCPTLLEDADDTDSSAADFAQGTPSPRSNSTPPTETACGNAAVGPDLVLSGKKKQKAGGKVVVKAQCTDQDCSLEAKGKSKLQGGAKSSATAAGRSVKLKKDSADAAQGATVKLKLKHSKSARKKVKRSVEGGGKAKAVVKVTATGAGGSTTEKFKAKLK